MNNATDNEAIIRSVVDAWKAGIEARRPEDVGALFTEDAIFQGGHPYAIGPQSVVDYYASQPLGMTASYRILETRRHADELVLGFLEVDFAIPDRPIISVNLCVLAKRVAGRWYVCHYQVSGVPITPF